MISTTAFLPFRILCVGLSCWLLTACGPTPADQAQADRYEALRTQMKENRAQVEELILQLPPDYQAVMRLNVDQVTNNDVTGFQKELGLKTTELNQLITSMETFMGRITASNAFVPTDRQKASYTTLRQLVLMDRATVEDYINNKRNKATAGVQDAQRFMVVNFLEKVMNYAVDDFLAISAVTAAEFREIDDMIEQWPAIVGSMTMYNAEAHMQ